MPIGAMLCKERADVFEPGNHASTFGGNPLACAAANCVTSKLDVRVLSLVRCLFFFHGAFYAHQSNKRIWATCWTRGELHGERGGGGGASSYHGMERYSRMSCSRSAHEIALTARSRNTKRSIYLPIAFAGSGVSSPYLSSPFSYGAYK